ncbi:FRG domain-containing protein [uncultured Winogradskyella sp.]|uniref:FRG domain-containing protein n=1 Tax=uncultured Winogradskyella sp. TaxID=395353 RepID=UPI00263107D0|nr:FRG domain-containing protein [uncultured Winogradskyella sp.]
MIEEINIKSARNFIDYIQLYQSHWTPESEWNKNWVFRGHAKLDWELKPIAHRTVINDQIKGYSDYAMPFTQKKWSEDVKNGVYKNSIIDWFSHEFCIRNHAYIYAERKILEEFCYVADQHGFKIPGAERFKNILPTDLSELPFPSRYDGMSIVQAIAQHHGMPTRLLDWTSNPLAAAFFACSEINSFDKNEESLCVWAVTRESIDKCNIPLNHSHSMSTEIFEVPRSEINYLNAQEGLFIGIKGANSFFSTTGKWPDLEKDVFEKDAAFENNVRKITLPHSEALELFRLLTLSNISFTSLMPNLDSIKKDVSTRWKLKGVQNGT